MSKRVLLFMATRSPVGGVATWLDQFCEHLDGCGWPTTVALVRGQSEHNPSRFSKFHPDLNSIEVDGRGLDRAGRIRICQRTVRKCNPSLVLPLGVLDANTAVIREKCEGRQIHLVGRAQGNLPAMLCDLQDLRDGLDHVVCVGAMTRRYLIQCAKFDDSRVTHIPNGASDSQVPHRPRQSGQPLRLGYVGRLSIEDKRVLDIPELCRNLDSRGVRYEMTIVGAGPAEAMLREQLAAFGDRVRMVGFKNGSEVYSDYLPNFDSLLLFSSSETFGVVLAEAMMNGVVPVTSRYIGFESEKLVVDGEHGLTFPVGDTAKAADAIQKLDAEPALLRRLSSAGRMHAQENYSWDACRERWFELAERIAARPPIVPSTELCGGESRQSGRLDRWGVPPGLVDTLRQVRRKMLRNGWQDGVEWPLFNRDHPPERLADVERYCRDIEETQRAACQGRRSATTASGK